eukprot:m.33126 g.33126  ORF g.33126 m.33126 type:complete len:53 (+) comp10987_c0_seq2:510-668(+)
MTMHTSSTSMLGNSSQVVVPCGRTKGGHVALAAGNVAARTSASSSKGKDMSL